MSSCSCIKGDNWRFDIECVDVKHIKYTDYSDWNEEAPYTLPEYHMVSITIPDINKTIQIKVKPKSSIIISAEDLAVGKCIPDGIWCFEAFACSTNCGGAGDKLFTKQKAVMCQTRCKIDNLIATSDNPKQAALLDSKLKQIETITKVGQSQKATELYTFLQDELLKLRCEPCC